jgi:acetyl esterase/lipase
MNQSLNLHANPNASNETNPAEDPRLFKQVREFLQVLNGGDGAPIETLPPKDAREVLSNAQEAVVVDYTGIQESEHTITVLDAPLKVYIVKPEGLSTTAPGFLYIHGGGWVLGDYKTHRRIVRDLVVQSGVIAIFPEYTPSPEARYPVALQQIYATLQWAATEGQTFGINGEKLAIVGNSVGGNMAAATTIMAKQLAGPALLLQVLLWPVTDANFETTSYVQYGKGRFLTTAMMKWFWDNYLPDPEGRQDILAAPLQASIEDLRGLPPALIQTAENDVLRDEGEAYGRKLNEAGVDVTVVRYNGLIHDYGLLNALSFIPAVKSAISQAAQALKRVLYA